MDMGRKGNNRWQERERSAKADGEKVKKVIMGKERRKGGNRGWERERTHWWRTEKVPLGMGKRGKK